MLSFSISQNFIMELKNWMRSDKNGCYTAQKKKFSIKNFFGKCDQIRSFLRICSYFRKESLMENFIFCTLLFQIY